MTRDEAVRKIANRIWLDRAPLRDGGMEEHPGQDVQDWKNAERVVDNILKGDYFDDTFEDRFPDIRGIREIVEAIER